MYVLMEAQNGAFDVLHGNQHVLNHMVLLVEFADGLSLSELQQRNLRRDHPAEHVAEQRIVSEWNDVLKARENMEDRLKSERWNLTKRKWTIKREKIHIKCERW